MEFDLEELNQHYNSTESKALEFIFIKILDILIDKPFIQDVKITLSMVKEIFVYEKFIDSVETFLEGFEQEIDEGKITIALKQAYYDYDEEQLQRLKPRFKEAKERLTATLPNKFYNFKILIKQ